MEMETQAMAVVLLVETMAEVGNMVVDILGKEDWEAGVVTEVMEEYEVVAVVMEAMRVQD